MGGSGYLFIYIRKDRLQLPVTVSAVGALRVPVWLLDLFVQCLKKNQSLEKSVQYWIGDLAEVTEDPVKLCKKKNPKHNPSSIHPFLI